MAFLVSAHQCAGLFNFDFSNPDEKRHGLCVSSSRHSTISSIIWITGAAPAKRSFSWLRCLESGWATVLMMTSVPSLAPLAPPLPGASRSRCSVAARRCASADT